VGMPVEVPANGSRASLDSTSSAHAVNSALRDPGHDVALAQFSMAPKTYTSAAKPSSVPRWSKLTPVRE